jgi:uncharacterized protein (DUF697 family)
VSAATPHVKRVLSSVPRVAREVDSADEGRPILVSGPPSAALELEQLLVAGGDPGAVRRVSVLELDDPELAKSPVLVYVIKGGFTPTDERTLRRAEWQSIPMMCLLLDGRQAGGVVLPYVRATDVIRAESLGPELIDDLARRIAALAHDAAPALARRLPALRTGVGEAIVDRAARRTAVLGALSGPADGPDLPAMALVELRMGMQVAAAHGNNAPPLQIATAVGALAGGFALRGLSRGLVAALPVPGWLVRASVAYGGARALGAAAVRLAQKAPVGADRAR